MLGALDDLAKHVQALLGRKLMRHQVALGELTLVVEAEHIAEVLTILRDDGQCQFEQLVDICGVDYPERSKRFDVVYHLLSMTKNLRVRIKVQTDEDTAVPSVVGVY